MGRPTNKEKFVKAVLLDIEHSQDPQLKTVYICLLKEKLDSMTRDTKLLLYDEVKSTIEGIYDITQKLNMTDDDHSLVLENIKAVLEQKYWSMYMDELLKENLIYASSNPI